MPPRDLDTDERRLLPTWIAFETQSNPDWEEQDTSVWPIQKFSWRDLTLRRSRNTLNIRQPFRAKYEIVPVGLEALGRAPVPESSTAQPGRARGWIPRAINTDKNPAYGEAIAALKKEGTMPRHVEHREAKYLNNRWQPTMGNSNA